MGLLDKFKKKSNTKEASTTQQKDYNIKYSINGDKLQIDFKENHHEAEQSYDTTRLVVSLEPFIFAGRQVSNCAVSWYNSSDVIFVDPKFGGEQIEARQYVGVLAELDTQALQQDESYAYETMKSLLNKERVMRYINTGLEEKPKQPCGKYIGGIEKEENSYIKFFSPDLGQASHYSDLMINRRREYRQKAEIQRQQEQIKAEKRAQIQKLQQEIDDMSR